MDDKTTIYHITCVMHNTRVSNRMIQYKVKSGNAVKLNLEQELILTDIIAEIIKKYNYLILAFNICSDHIHFVIVCNYEEISSIVQAIKSISSREFRKEINIPTVLWAKKFNKKIIDKEKQLTDTINYVDYNRIKHNLPDNEKLKEIIGKMITPIETAFA